MSESHNFGRHSNHIFIGIAIVCTAILIAIFSSEGFADFSTSTVTQSLVGVRTNVDSSFIVRNIQLSQSASNSLAGSATGTTFELANPYPTVRLNTINIGDAYYRLQFHEDAQMTSGTWIIKFYSEGVQVGSTVTITQNTPDNASEGVDLLVGFGGVSIPKSHLYYVEVIKTS